MADIVIADRIEETAVRDLGQRFNVRYDHRLSDDPDELSRAVETARALIVGDCTLVDADLLERARNLEVIGCLTGQPGRIVDEEACRSRGIAVYALSDDSQVERVSAVVLSLFDRAWSGLPSSEWLLGLIGFGDQAREVARRAKARGLRVAAYDPMLDHGDPIWAELGVEPMPLHRLLQEAMVLSLHAPLTDETRNLIDWETIAEMREGAVLVNASRADLVDAGAVRSALRGGRLGGAMLDLESDEISSMVPPDARIGSLIAEKVRATLEARQPG